MTPRPTIWSGSGWAAGPNSSSPHGGVHPGIAVRRVERGYARPDSREPSGFEDGLDGDGEEVRGLHHMSFARRLTDQYEWPVLMWRTNPDFPEPGSGGGELYKIGGAANMSGGYYFMPPAAPGSGHVGAGLLD